MIAAINNYIVSQCNTIDQVQDGGGKVPLRVYAPGPHREKGERKTPNLAITLAAFLPDIRRSKPHLDVFSPSVQTVATELPDRFGSHFPAQVEGSVVGPFTIEENVNDRIRFRVQSRYASDGWAPVEGFQLLAGERDAAEICAEINVWSTGVLATAESGIIRLETEQPGIDLEILDGDQSAWETLGFVPGVVSRLTQVGPASWTIKRAPTPCKALYQIDVNTTTLGQQIGLWGFILDMFPHGHRAMINGQWVKWLMENPKNLDELEKPQLRTAFRWWVEDFSMDRIRAQSVQSILDVQMGISL